jgi:hypothetical protein
MYNLLNQKRARWETLARDGSSEERISVVDQGWDNVSRHAMGIYWMYCLGADEVTWCFTNSSYTGAEYPSNLSEFADWFSGMAVCYYSRAC